MSKIEELAEKFAQEAYSNPVDRNVGKADFMAGANAVLKEIENIIELEETTFVYTLEQYIKTQYLKDKIKELKGD